MSSKKASKNIYLIDISSLFFRSYYAISLNMKNEKGLPTNALYGVLKMMDQLVRKTNPDHMVCCFDSKVPSFRKDIYPEYKANRGEMPEDLEAQVPFLKKMMATLLIPSWENPGFEADDLVASLAGFANKKKWTTYIVSGDKDFAQLVNPNTYLYDTMKDVIYDPTGVEERWGIPPHQMQDYLSLVGDSSDNIPGVRGVGPKGAVKLLKDYGNLENVYKNVEKLKGSIKEKLIKDKELAFLSRKLVALREDLEWDSKLFKWEYKPVADFSEKDKEAFKDFLEEMNFKSFLKKFFPGKTESPKPSKDSWQEPSKSLRLSSKPHLKIHQIALEEFKRVLPPYADIWIGRFKDRFYLADKKYFAMFDESHLKELSEFLDDKWVRYQGHDLKFFWKKLQIKKPLAFWDSLIAGHLVYSLTEPSLRSLFERELQILEDEELNLPQTLYQEQKLKESFLEKLEKEGMLPLFQNIELPLIPVLYDMENQGFLIDLKEVKKQSESLGRDIKNLEFQIHSLAGETFNVSSTKQLALILFEKLGLPRGRKTKTGYSTDSHELMKIKDLHPILPLLLEHRELFKLKSTYTDSLLSLRDKETGRVYTEFKQAVVATGRLSSVNPNLQNIPIRTERGQMIRKAFIAGPGKELICADYSQLELRILAHITGDKNLKKAFEEGLDIHAMTASEIFNIPLKEVSSDLRRKSKAVNFGIAYGQGVYGLADTLSISRAEAREIIDNYFKKFKKIKDYIETVKKELPKKSYVKTLYGRKRFFPTEDLKQPRMKAAIERAAINAPLQGTASELVKIAMIALKESLPIPILSQVHDELLFECPKDSVKRESLEIASIMEKGELLNVPLTVNISSGKSWFVAHS